MEIVIVLLVCKDVTWLLKCSGTFLQMKGSEGVQLAESLGRWARDVLRAVRTSRLVATVRVIIPGLLGTVLIHA